ncbi:MAG TPA: GNAT family N-acetyltransferase [Longimicrobiales bacterium]|nr:GNAT family N-acetyltransferase [Longimicrobiales bacterium]
MDTASPPGSVDIVRLAGPSLPALLARILELEEQVLAELGTRYSHERWTEAHLRTERPDKWRLSAAALDGGRVVGYAIASRDGRTAHVHRIAVRREARGQGIARGLVEWIEAEARIMGLGELRTSVADANHRALAFWRRLGFRPVEGAALEAYAARRGLPVSGSCYLAGGNRYRVLRRAVRDRA